MEEKTNTIQEHVFKITKEYLNSVDTKNLYNFVTEVVEEPLLEATMNHCKYNQVRAAKILGISRGNLRKKLIKHFDDKYCGSREN